MIRAVMLLLVASLVLGACGGWSDSRLNPGNWFGRSQAVPTEGTAEPANPLIPRGSSVFRREERPDTHVAITKVTELVIERTNTGAIIRAEGVAAFQGAYEARLRPQTETGDPENGVMTYVFEINYPVNPRPVGNENSRTIVVARSLTNQELAPIRVIRVTAEQNARESRRR